MRISLKTKIWVTILAIVMMFAFFILYYFPAQQEKHLLTNYNKEVQNLANTVALGVKIALTEQNFEGVQTAIGFVKDDPHLAFVCLLQVDTVWNQDQSRFSLSKEIFQALPANKKVDPYQRSSDSVVVKNASFNTQVMNGEVMLGFTTKEIVQSKMQIRTTSLLVSLLVFAIGITIGFWLARNISVPVLALRDAANKVGEGDLTQRVTKLHRDEIGELGIAFNKMVDDLGRAQKQISDRTHELVMEKKKSDELLLNILPADTAEELKITGSAQAKQYPSVTVLFADFRGFTRLSEKLHPQVLVAELNFFFSAFDRIVEKYNIEKIKTIGDAYMCAGGLPVENDTHAEDVVKAAVEMRDFIRQHRSKESELVFEIRIGVNTGPVVAGIVGLRKFAYDIWGDTVNIASRMETTSEPGKINISGATYELIKDRFDCVYRGKINAKNKGEIDMYFVEGLKNRTISVASDELITDKNVV
ncbi:MAG TPA: adenylate/guanylate cyclase domain-containing protein [Flavisolibacter sp.]|nr:adenylate/guanylate cyclase domain-containing protein [Flavisolibacter sp.]